MTKYTQDQLLAMTKEQLDEIVALAQGWSRSDALKPAIEAPLVLGDLHFWYDNNRDFKEFISNYHPSTSKEQMVDLMLKCKLSVDVDSQCVMTAGWAGDCHSIHLDVTPMSYPEAVAIAAILHLQESE